MVKIRIVSWDYQSDVFKLSAFGFTPKDRAADPEYAEIAEDFDDFEVPGVVLPALIGEYDDPDELIDKVFEVKLPK